MRHPALGSGRPCLLALMLLLTVSTEAWAQLEPEAEPPVWDDSFYPFAREGAYASVGGFYALENFDREAAFKSSTPLDISGDDGGGISLRGGYRFLPHFSAEALFEYYLGFGVKERFSRANDNFEGWSLLLAGKGYALLGAIQPYAIAGVGGLTFREKQRGRDSGFIARLGGGIDLYLTDHLVVEAEAAYVLPAGDIEDFEFATVGGNVLYRF